MKISIFYKSYIFKAYFSLVFFALMTSLPNLAQAGLFSDLAAKVFGQTIQASELEATESSIDNNSQTIALLESSIDPDMISVENQTDVVIYDNEALLPMEGPQYSDVKFEKSSLSDKIYVYTVETGDTLSGIAEMFDVSINTIRWENNISDQKIAVGQKLNILPVTGVKHIVKKGDTISKIAQKYDSESEDISIYNGLSFGDGLKQGDILFVPNGIIKTVVAKTSSGTKVYTATNVSNTKLSSGYYIKPVSGKITSPYGSRKGGFHYGIDYGNSRGTQIVAAAAGVVTNVVGYCKEGQTSCGGRYGNYIMISHSNGTISRYAHLSSVNVSVGQEVSQGQSIATLGNTGRSTGPHLHFQIENGNGSTVRPVF